MQFIFKSYLTVALTSWFPQVNRLQYCDWVERDNSNRNALVWKKIPSHPSVFLHFIVPIVVKTNLHHLMFHHVNQVTPHMFNIVAKVLVYENNLYWREDVLDDPEDDLALSTGSIHHVDLTKMFCSYIRYLALSFALTDDANFSRWFGGLGVQWDSWLGLWGGSTGHQLRSLYQRVSFIRTENWCCCYEQSLPHLP